MGETACYDLKVVFILSGRVIAMPVYRSYVCFCWLNNAGAAFANVIVSD